MCGGRHNLNGAMVGQNQRQSMEGGASSGGAMVMQQGGRQRIRVCGFVRAVSRFFLFFLLISNFVSNLFCFDCCYWVVIMRCCDKFWLVFNFLFWLLCESCWWCSVVVVMMLCVKVMKLDCRWMMNWWRKNVVMVAVVWKWCERVFFL